MRESRKSGSVRGMAQTSRIDPATGGAVPTLWKYALNWTRLSCHRFVANRVRLSLFVLAYNLGNFLAGCVCPRRSGTGRCGACRSS